MSALDNGLRGALLLMSALFILSYVLCALVRISYPFELEWMEGGVAEHVCRILSGEPLYPPPSLEFTPYTYPPLYFYGGAGFMMLLGGEFLPLRLLSLLASLVVMGGLGYLIRCESRSTWAGVIGVGIFAATYGLSGYWFDIARIDSLFLALLIAGAVLQRMGSTSATAVAAALCYLLAFATKQVAAVVVATLVLGEIARGCRTRGLVLLGVLGLGGAAYYLIGYVVTDGWFHFYLFESPRTRWRQFISLHSLTSFLAIDIFATFLPTLVLVLASIMSGREPRWRPSWFVTALVLGLVFAAGMGRVERINYLNTLIPLHLAMALLTALTWCDRKQRSATWNVTASLLVLIQFTLFLYDPRTALPSTSERERGVHFMSSLARLPGPLFWPDHPHLLRAIGAPPSAHTIGISDALLGDSGSAAHTLRAEITQAFEAHRYRFVLLDSGLFETLFGSELTRYYRELAPEENPINGCVPVHGFCAQPGVLVPRD